MAALQPVDRVLSALRDRDGLLYFEAGDELWLITVRGRRLGLRKLAAPTAEIRDLADRFLGHPDDVSLATRLGEILLPEGALPEAGQPVYVVADGVLGNLPFAALRRQGRFLVEDHGIVFVPSLNALAALEAPRASPAGPEVALADPQRNLPAAAAEAVEVAHQLGGTAWTAGEATSRRLRQAAHSRTLHLATHTGLGPRGAWLQLADRRVAASEIVSGRIGPRLVVLASCASGVRPGREMWGSLGASFLAAGSRAVLASLWSVEDGPTRELVRRFYAEGGDADPCAAWVHGSRAAPSPEPDPEHAALAALERGSHDEALAVLMRVYGSAVYRYCRQMVADDDLAQEVHQMTFIQAYESLARFGGRSSLRTWLFGIARHRCLDLLKMDRRRRGRFDPLDVAPDLPGPDANVEDLLAERSRTRLLPDCLRSLAPPRARYRPAALPAGSVLPRDRPPFGREGAGPPDPGRPRPAPLAPCRRPSAWPRRWPRSS